MISANVSHSINNLLTETYELKRFCWKREKIVTNARFSPCFCKSTSLRVIPELRGEMDRACRTNVPGLGRSYFSEPNIRHKLELPEERSPSFNDFSMYSQNVGDWVKRSIMGDMTQGVHAEAMTCLPSMSIHGCYQTDRRPRDEMENYWLMQKTQQIAQSRSDDGCTCVQYTPDVPRCTCQFPEEHAKIKVENLTPGKQNCYKTQSANQDVWMNELLDIESQNERLQKEKLIQSLAVPDLSMEYPYYMGYHDDNSIYEQEQSPMPLINNLPEKPTGLSTFQRVPNPKSTNGSADASPVNSPKPPKAKSSRPRLCHFLLELLANPQQYSDVVEWVDKEKGVFKFLNSSEVASQWGRRRNKPHMKYENFARSLRTYIAKGILTKPRSKLVYRFTNKVY